MANRLLGRRAALKLVSAAALLATGCHPAQGPVATLGLRSRPLCTFDLASGVVSGDRLRGKILDASGVADPRAELRLVLQADDGALILWRGHAVEVEGGKLRVTSRFETAAPAYAFLQSMVVVGSTESERATFILEEIL